MNYLPVILGCITIVLWSQTQAGPRFTENENYFQQLHRYYQTPATTDWEQQHAGEYYVENNVWNKGNTKGHL